MAEQTKSKKRYLEYLYEQYKKGLLDKSKIELLRSEGYIREGVLEKEETGLRYQREVTTGDDWLQLIDPFHRATRYTKLRDNINREDWAPQEILSHTAEFVNWINSMVYGFFHNKAYYKKFEYYKAQAWKWLQDDDTITSYHTDDGKRIFMQREYDRCAENTFYFADKYGELKEGDIASGYVKYAAREHQAVIFYLFDCGYNVIGGKGRQIGFTSAMGICALKKMLYQSNYYIKFITEDKETGEEIFNDKIKYPFGALPKWMQPRVKSDSGTRFWLSDKRKKGEKGYPNSRIDVIAPKKTAINGGSPQLVLIDEIGNIFILGAMLNEGRPTMFWNNPITGKFELKRQVWMWGTGGEMDKGKGAYEKEWYRILGLWEAGKYVSGFVPLFFSWHSRFSTEEYEIEKLWYYGARAMEKDIDLETSKTQFHQHYPSTYKDMFRTTASTLVARDIIDKGLDRCRTMDVTLRPVYGYYEPIYDTSDPMPPESDTPYRIIGSDFVVIDDEDNLKKATAIMFQRPERGWKYRYWQGTDPIATETGHSKLASTIWDEYFKTVSCVINYRKQHDHKKAFLQCMLMGLYYDTDNVKDGVKELVEANIGTNYIDYKQSKGYFNSLIFNSQLPIKVSGGVREVGIDNHAGPRADGIIEYMTEVIRNYHSRIYIQVVFDQLTTFVQTVSPNGKEIWGPMNKLMHYDDVLYSLSFAYICRQCYSYVYPVQEIVKASRYVTRYPLTRVNGSMIRLPKRVPVVEHEYHEIPNIG